MQSRTMSFVEALTNVVVGFGIAVTFDPNVSISTNGLVLTQVNRHLPVTFCVRVVNNCRGL